MEEEVASSVGEQALWFVLVSLLWGATNPFLKKGGAGIEGVKHSNRLLKFLLEMKFLLLNWKYMLPFGINQLGAVLYYTTIGRAEITTAVPITNSLTFLFTTLFGRLLGEHTSTGTVLGALMVLTGVLLCVTSKIT